jgi:transposase
MELPNDIASCHRIILELASIIEGFEPRLKGYIQQIETQRGQIEAQRDQIAHLELRVKELESQTKQNSRNSSRPPSSDMYRQKPAFPRVKGGKVGGKEGHDGGTLKMVPAPDIIIDHHEEMCTRCGKAHFQEPLSMRGRRQVFDIPPPRIEVTEHRVLDWVCCGCQYENQGKFPVEVSAPTQYGLRLQTTSVLFNNAYSIPRNKVQLIFKDLYGATLNPGTLQTQQVFACAQLEGEEAHIKDQLLKSEVVHFDETGFYVGKERYWEHVASNERYTYLFVHFNRGKEAHEEHISILPDFRNWAIHDCWATYFNFLSCKHGVCGSHLLRELTALIENGSKWATKCHALLLDLYHRTDHGKGKLPAEALPKILTRYNKILQLADHEEPPPIHRPRGKPKQTKGRNLFDRLTKHHEAVLAFAVHQKVPFTNNQAERDVRPTKTKMKVSGCFRTEYGAEIYARIQSFVSTVRKLQFNPFKELYTVLSGGIPEYRSVSC